MKKELLSRTDIILLVDTFYHKVQQDPKIGFIFNDIAKVNWAHHLPKMYDFWDSILFGSALYKGNPMIPHFSINQQKSLQAEEFMAWKNLFFDTVNELFEGDNATLIKEKAQSIADLMFFKLNAIHVIPAKK